MQINKVKGALNASYKDTKLREFFRIYLKIKKRVEDWDFKLQNQKI